jgi:hypothetical protein
MASKLILKNLENTELTIAHRDGNLAKLIYSDELTVSVATVALMEAIATPDDGATCIVKDMDRGGIFVYDSSLVGSDNQGTNFNGWIRQYSGAVERGWFDSDANYTSYIESSLGEDTTWLDGATQPNLGWIANNATKGTYNDEGRFGYVGAARSSTVDNGASIGLIGVGVNDNIVVGSGVWASYLDAKSYSGAIKATWGCELQITNLGTYVGMYDASERKTYGLAIGAGGDTVINGVTEAVTSGLSFTTNGAVFGAGITFGASTLLSHTNTAGDAYYRAMIMRNSQSIVWEGTSGERYNSIIGKSTTQANETTIEMRNNVIELNGGINAKTIVKFGNNEGNNYTYLSNSGGSPKIEAQGISTDIDVWLQPKGTGNARFGDRVASADQVVTGYIEIKDNTGAIRKLAVIG